MFLWVTEVSNTFLNSDNITDLSCLLEKGSKEGWKETTKSQSNKCLLADREKKRGVENFKESLIGSKMQTEHMLWNKIGGGGE